MASTSLTSYIRLFHLHDILARLWNLGHLSRTKNQLQRGILRLVHGIQELSFVFRTGGEAWFTYSFHAWSIPVEFRVSIIVYTALLAFSRSRRNARLLGEVGLILYFMYIVDDWFGSMFMAGMLLCDLDLLARNDDLPFPNLFSALAPFKSIIFYTFFIISILLGGVPSRAGSTVETLRNSPMWYYLSFLKLQAVYDYK
ncbi:hypothetical protein G7Y89_g6888 [Cudoniella acicularis]|uniref:Uncharacterized protein n=1 Tax=Cudoniella acicularis TaxID=354080 RepID=A0A8H4RLX0_9HELO|nr:hypothetical protein G7Y89_g6888 [Cudoniella acicularis]